MAPRKWISLGASHQPNPILDTLKGFKCNRAMLIGEMSQNLLRQSLFQTERFIGEHYFCFCALIVTLCRLFALFLLYGELKIESSSTAVDFAAQSAVQQCNPI